VAGERVEDCVDDALEAIKEALLHGVLQAQ
jgi:hypothetical protein